MKTVKLFQILFEADDAGMNLDIGKDVADAVTQAIEPVTKDVEQMKKDINVIQKTTGKRKEEPTNARSTTGASQSVSATTVPKGPGTVSTTGTSKPSAQDDGLKKDVDVIKKQVGDLTAMAKNV
jgi:tartrate dehydratase alpha subunit/fumarate hydratase class I-like protein